MKFYIISCPSSCGSYFAAYLQSLTIQADTEAEAIEKAEKWQEFHGEHFIRPTKECCIEEVVPDRFGVVNSLIDSDY